MSIWWRMILKNPARLVWQVSEVIRGEKRASSIPWILTQDATSDQWKSSQSCSTPWPSGHPPSGSTSTHFTRTQGKEHNSITLVQRCEVEAKTHTDTFNLTQSKRWMTLFHFFFGQLLPVSADMLAIMKQSKHVFPWQDPTPANRNSNAICQLLLPRNWTIVRYRNRGKRTGNRTPPPTSMSELSAVVNYT